MMRENAIQPITIVKYILEKFLIVHWNCVCVCAKSLQLCLIFCDPMDCRLPGSSGQGIL